MKTGFHLFALLAFVASSLQVSAQGTIIYYNRLASGGVFAPVYGVPTSLFPFEAPLLSGTGYYAGLWAGPVGSTEDQLSFVTGSLRTFRTSSAFAGSIENEGPIAIPGVPEGSPAVLQLRAWDNLGGTITSYQAAGIRGASPIFTSLNLGGDEPPPTMIGLQSFYLVPEPSSYFILALGAVIFWMNRRK